MAKRGSSRKKTTSQGSGGSSGGEPTPRRQRATKPASADSSGEPSLLRVHVWQIQAVRDLLVVAAVVGLVWFGYALRAVTVPLLVALLLAYLVEPVIARMCRHPKISRPTAVSSIMVGGVGLLLIVAVLLVPLVISQTAQFIDDIRDGTMRRSVAKIERYLPDTLRDDYRLLYERLPIGRVERMVDKAIPEPLKEELEEVANDAPDVSDAPAETEPGEAAGPEERDASTNGSTDVAAGEDDSDERLRELIDERVDARVSAEMQRIRDQLRQDRAGAPVESTDVWGLARRGLTTVFSMIGTVLGIGLLTFLIPFYFFFFSLWYPDVVKFGRQLLPKRNKERVLELLVKMDNVVAGFVRGRIVISFIMGILLAIGWMICGVPYAIPVGIVVGIFCAVPYLGGVGIPLAIALLFYKQLGVPADERMAWWGILLWPTLVFAIVQLIEGYVLTPAIAGKATKLDPVTIVVVVLAGGSVLGVYGMLLAIPIAACGKILVTEVLMPRIRAWTRGEIADPLPIERD
jgi:predicted PurR-regulated permease PerM